MNTIETIEQMVDALQEHGAAYLNHEAASYAEAIQAGLALLEELKGQEPVAWGNLANWCLDSDRVLITDKTEAEKYHRDVYDLTPLYKHPQPAQPKAETAQVQDEHQAFIDSLPKDSDDKMFMQIDKWARESYKRHKSSVCGQMITAADSYESHIIWATLRWSQENTQPAAQPKAEGEHALEQALTRLQKRYNELEAKVAAQPKREWVGLTDEEIDGMVEVTDLSGAYYYDDLYAVVRAAEAKLKAKNTQEPINWSDYESDGRIIKTYPEKDKT